MARGTMDRWLVVALCVLATGTALAAAPGDERGVAAPYRVFFDWGKTVISQDSAATLDDVAEVLLQPGERMAHLVGHSDRSGPANSNHASALRRATAARDYLVSRGASPQRLSIASQGENAPFIATADGVREPQNRRVDIMIYSPVER